MEKKKKKKKKSKCVPTVECVPRVDDATGSTSNDVDVEPSNSTSATSLSSSTHEFDTCIDFTNNVYTCKICEVTIKQKRNVKPHLKSKRHLQTTKERVAMRDEAIAGTGELNEVAFTRNTENPRPGCHFLLGFKAPIKYKIARRLMKMACSCVLCLKAFRSSELYGRHTSSREHKNKVKIEKEKRRLWNNDDEFRFNDASTHEGHLRQSGELTWFCSETIIMISHKCIKCKTRKNLKI